MSVLLMIAGSMMIRIPSAKGVKVGTMVTMMVMMEMITMMMIILVVMVVMVMMVTEMLC